MFAFIFEFVDTALGGGYGTIMTPLLLIFSLQRLDIVPAILFSEIFTGISGATMHHFYGNADFSREGKTNWNIFILISIIGIGATIFAVFLAVELDKLIINTYIGILVLFIGVLMMLNRKYKFSWKKIGIVGTISAFNKSISGGGFGPLITAGQVVSGRDTKNSIATALACEAPICLAGLITYFVLESSTTDFLLLSLALIIGAVPATIVGAFTTKKIKDEYRFKQLTGVFIILLGAFVLLKTYKIIFP
ncbi:MAG: sulfite exporter TauE/SafE family protein [Promethearchaeota archaeon]